MKFNELKDLTAVELTARSRDMQQELFNLKLQKATSQLEKTNELRRLRRDIARLQTRISQLRHQSA